jgi:nitrogen fixation protein NifX
MKIAFASKDGIYVNEHFGWCKQFYLYELNGSKFDFLHIIDSPKELDDEINKLVYKIESLGDSNIVYVAQIGPKASQMVKASGIYPMQSVNENEKIDEVLKKIAEMALSYPPLWMQRLLNSKR